MRIFRICDRDADGFLSDDELREFQSKVFGKDLQLQHITAFKDVLIAECEDYDETMAMKGVNFEAFKTFQKIIIRKLKMEVSWQILRHFGYDNNLELKESLWSQDSCLSDQEIKTARSFELTKGASDFLAGLYKQYQ